MRNRDLLSAQQQQAVDFIKAKPSCALWADMGTGKTIATLTALRDLFNQFEIGRVLVIAPLRVVINTWPDEIGEWAHTQGLTHTLLRGTPAERLRLMHTNTDIHLINRELVPDLVKTLGKKWHYDTVVIDEASSFKSHGSQRFKALRKVLPYIDRLIELTGTPASNGYMDLWSQVFLLDRGQRLGKTITAYRQRYFVADYMGYNWNIREGAAEQIENTLKDVVLRLEYPHTTQPIINPVRVTLPSKAREQYTQLEKEFLLHLESDTVEATTAAVLSNKLRQCANGAIYTDDVGGYWTLHDEKLDALEEIINETNSPVLVAYSYKHDLKRLKEAFPHAETLDAPDALKRWNAGEIPLLLTHPASAGHGLNMQHGGHTLVWFGLDWSLELYEQFNARLHRQGQKHQVVIHHIIARDTIDETVMRAINDKHITQKALLDALKQDIEGRVKQ